MLVRILAPLVLASLLTPASDARQTVAPRVPLSFEPTPHAGEFFARGEDGVTWRLAGGSMTARAGGGSVTLTLAGARADAKLEQEDATGAKSHYFVGNDPALWRSDVPRYATLRARGVLPGVDLVHHGSGSRLEFDLVLHPGAAPQRLAFRAEGARGLAVDPDGAVAIATSSGTLRLLAPVVWQEQGSTRQRIDCRYAVEGDAILLQLGAHDPDLDVTVDPVVTFATLLGGDAGSETVKGVTVDPFGATIVVGTTSSSDFPLLANLNVAYRFNICFVTKFDAAGGLVFSTFFGGTSGSVTPVDVGTDPDGQIVFGGNTTSTSLPTTIGVVQPTGDGGDWFFTDLGASGSLNWCTYYGGTGNQGGMSALKVLPIKRGSVVAVGNLTGLPTLPNAYSTVGNVAVAGIFGGNIVFVSTECGISAQPTAVDVSSQGHICITGTVNGTSGLPTTVASYQQFPANSGSNDGFVFVFFGDQNSLVYASYLGGTGNDQPRRIRAGTGPGSVILTVAGDTSSSDFPVQNAIQPQYGGSGDAFVSRIVAGVSGGLDFSTYLGGSSIDQGMGLAVDENGRTIVGGMSHSLDLPFKDTMKLTNSASGADAWVARLDATGAQLDWLTAWGGGGDEALASLAVGPTNEIVLAGSTAGVNTPVTPNALPSGQVSQDGFVVRLDPRTDPSYGTGTPGYFGFVPVLAGGGSVKRGTSATFNVHDGRAQAIGLLGFGVGRAQIPFAGGFLLTNPLGTLPLALSGSTATGLTTRGGGYLHFSIPIPPGPAFHGIPVDWQAVFSDASATGGWSLTNGVELTID